MLRGVGDEVGEGVDVVEVVAPVALGDQVLHAPHVQAPGADDGDGLLDDLRGRAVRLDLQGRAARGALGGGALAGGRGDGPRPEVAGGALRRQGQLTRAAPGSIWQMSAGQRLKLASGSVWILIA